MDALAYLCNLHADGPTTHQKLLREGLDTLAAVLEAEDFELAELLGWGEVRARRFQREAGVLATRDEGLLVPLAPGSARPEEPPSVASVTEDPAADRQPEAGQGSGGPGPGRRLRAGWREEARGEPSRSSPQERVLGAWRDLDEEDPPADPDVLVPTPPRRVGHPVAEVSAAWLSGDLCARLRRAGLDTLEDLIQATTLELVDPLELGYTRCRRLQHLARRTVQTMQAVSRP